MVSGDSIVLGRPDLRLGRRVYHSVFERQNALQQRSLAWAFAVSIEQSAPAKGLRLMASRLSQYQLCPVFSMPSLL